MLEEGEVAKVDFKWPQDARLDDGTKARACTVFATRKAADGTPNALFVVPQHGLMPGETPRGVAAKYAFKLPRRLQAQLGLLKKDRHGVPYPDQKDSWVMPHIANMVDVPQNPAMTRIRRSDGTSGWSMGKMPPGIMARINEAREQAIAAGDFRIFHIANTVAPVPQTRSAPSHEQTRASKPTHQSERDARISERAQVLAVKRTTNRNHRAKPALDRGSR